MTDYEKLIQCFQGMSVSYGAFERATSLWRAKDIREDAQRAIEVACTTFWFTEDGRYLGCVDDDFAPSWEVREDEL